MDGDSQIVTLFFTSLYLTTASNYSQHSEKWVRRSQELALVDPYYNHTFEIPERVNVNLRSDMAKKGKTNWLICLNNYCKLIQVNKLTYFRFLPRTEQAAVVESAQQAAVVECAQELRRVGDLLDWKYRLLELIITLQKKQTGGKRWNRQLLGRSLWILNQRRPSISRGFISEDEVRRLAKTTKKVDQEYGLPRWRHGYDGPTVDHFWALLSHIYLWTVSLRGFELFVSRNSFQKSNGGSSQIGLLVILIGL